MGVSLVAANEAPQERGQEMWLKRQAIQIVSQLPEDRAQALAVLAYAKLLMDFMSGEIRPGV